MSGGGGYYMFRCSCFLAAQCKTCERKWILVNDSWCQPCMAAGCNQSYIDAMEKYEKEQKERAEQEKKNQNKSAPKSAPTSAPRMVGNRRNSNFKT